MRSYPSGSLFFLLYFLNPLKASSRGKYAFSIEGNLVSA